MDSQLKKNLLLRKFSSIEYMEEFKDYHCRTLETMEEGIEYFYNHPPSENWHLWDRSEWPETWESRAVANFREMQDYLQDALERAKRGDTSYLESAAADFSGIGKDMDVMGEKWWSYIPAEYEEKFIKNRAAAAKHASNIWRTLGDYWKTPDSVLKETVTGPIDEQDLLCYLKPGEQP